MGKIDPNDPDSVSKQTAIFAESHPAGELYTRAQQPDTDASYFVEDDWLSVGVYTTRNPVAVVDQHGTVSVSSRGGLVIFNERGLVLVPENLLATSGLIRHPWSPTENANGEED